MLVSKRMLPVAAVVLFCACKSVQKTTQSKNGTGASATQTASAKADTSKKNKLKPYKEVITDKAVTDSGLFIVHKVEDKYYFELPNSVMDRDILMVNRIAKAATASARPAGYFFGYGGDEIGEIVFQFSKGPNNKLFMKQISFLHRSMDSSANGMYRAVRNSNVQPIIASFDIKALSADSSAVVVDFTDLIGSDNQILFFNDLFREVYKPGAFQSDKSYIEGVRSYPENVEIKTLKTYGAGAGEMEQVKTYELNSSIVLLPSQPMQPRYYDDRVGYFAEGYIDYDANPQRVEVTFMINRWRLEPKEEDMERYKRGELVEPKKPIVFYIDPATPKRWVPYLIQGVNDWQKAFEQAGFKNAIYAREAPTDDSTWSMEDVRNSVIVYKATFIANAYGPNVHDPRTGEIMESKVGWFHNVMNLLHDWYMIQAAPNDPRARKMQFDDELMGQLIRFVSSHEIGHTLGLLHNFGASSTIPVDSLRSKRYVEANGHTPSIMDYARFNYVAQPEDNISERGIFPRIGVYDEWAIEWGYRWLPQLKNKEDERAYMNKWIEERVGKDKRLWYGSQLSPDPRCQSEDVGAEPWKAGVYGIKNLKRVMNNLEAWTVEPGKDYSGLTNIKQGIISQYNRYITHAANYIGGSYYVPQRAGANGEIKGRVFDFPSRQKQRAAFQFLNDELFHTTDWLAGASNIGISGTGPSALWFKQQRVLKYYFSNSVLGFMYLYGEKYSSEEPYKVSELLDDFTTSFWDGLRQHKPIDANTRGLQRLHIEGLTYLLGKPDVSRALMEESYYVLNGDIRILVRAQLQGIAHYIDHALPGYKDALTRGHLEEMKRLINKALKPEKGSNEEGDDHSGHSHLNGIDGMDLETLMKQQQEFRDKFWKDFVGDEGDAFEY